MENELYNVVQFFENEMHEYVRRGVSALEAVQAVKHYTDNVATRAGIIARVIITDMMDCTVFEWTYGKGITYPTQEMVDEVMNEVEKYEASEENRAESIAEARVVERNKEKN